MGYLFYRDYNITIQDRVYVQLVQNNDAKRIAAEQWAISMVRGKITQKYDVDKEFTNTTVWDPAKVYQVRSRVIVDAPVWVTLTTYTAGVSLVLLAGIVYLCNTNNSDATFTSGKWDAIGAQYSVYYASYPPTCTYQGRSNPATLANPYAPEFSLINIAEGGAQNLYNAGDVVFYKGYTYTAVVNTMGISQANIIQYNSYKDVPYINVFPDDAVNNAANQFWGSKTAYTVPAGTLPTNDTYWTADDNRTPEIKECVKDLAIWRLSGLTNQRRAEWEERKNGVVEILAMYANGTATLLMPRRMIPGGTRARSGGKPKQQNFY